jgi:quercetin dioxygenase-like cupin family protein
MTAQQAISLADGIDGDIASVLAESLAPIDPAKQLLQDVRGRLLDRAAQSVAADAGYVTTRGRDLEWTRVKDGAWMKLLRRGAQGNSVLIRVEAGAVLPAHRHRWVEEGIVIDGDMRFGDRLLRNGDYHRSVPGSRHERIGSDGGGVAFLCGTSLGDTGGMLMELLGGVLPFRGDPPVTRLVVEGRWTAVAEGVEECTLRNGPARSRLVRMAPGSHFYPGSRGVGSDDERLVVSGEAFFGDVLLQQGDYQEALSVRHPDRIETDVGALLFLRGDSAPA